MDNTNPQNLTNQTNLPVGDSLLNPLTNAVSASPVIDITPQETAPNSAPGNYHSVTSGLDDPIFIAPPSVVAPISTPMGTMTSTETSASAPTPISMDTPAPSENLDAGKMPQPKKRMSPLLMGAFTLIFLGVAGSGVFVVSRAISGQASVAPTAPESEPRAFEPTPTEAPIITESYNPDGTLDCSSVPNTAPFGDKCRSTIIDEFGNITWAPEISNSDSELPPVTESPAQ